jgi:4-nitrophenyl phosphatase
MTTIRSLILDMDGVLWRGDTPIGDLSWIFAHLNRNGIRYAFATNNGSKTPEQYVERLSRFGIEANKKQVLTSSLSLVKLIGQRYPVGSYVYAIGEDGLLCALREDGFIICPEKDTDKASLVVMGIDRNITFQKVSEAALLINKGVPFYATNPDKTFPTARGEIPGAGAWISVITTSTGITPIFAGKPAPHLIELAYKQLGTDRSETLVVGDRIETDIAAGQAAGLPVALVLSGVGTLAEANTWKPKIDFIASDLQALVTELDL